MSKLNNTKISYTYRDASNYKTSETVIVRGLVSRESLLECCDMVSDGSEFIPSQVGLEDLQSRMESFPSEDDHVWHGLEEVEPTDDPPTIEITAAQLQGNFLTSKGCWDIWTAHRKVFGFP